MSNINVLRSWIFFRTKCLKYTFQQYWIFIALRKFGGRPCTFSPTYFFSSNTFKIHYRTCKIIVLPGDLLIDEQHWPTCLNKVSHLLQKLTFISMLFNVVCKLVLICFTGGRLLGTVVVGPGTGSFLPEQDIHKLCKTLSLETIRNCFL